MNWFRFYHEALDDPKVQRLDGETFKVWVNLLCLASRARDRGTLPSVVDIAFALRMDEDETSSIITALVNRKLLAPTETGFAPHNWAERQPRSDDINARVRKHRSMADRGDGIPLTIVADDGTLRETLLQVVDVTEQDVTCNGAEEIREEEIRVEKRIDTPLPPTGETPAKPEQGPIYPKAMELFWSTYDPQGRERSSRAQVFEVWSRMKPSTELTAAIMEGLERWVVSEKWREGFAPGAHLFLKRRLWAEQPAPPTTAATPPRRGSPTAGNADAFRIAKERAAQRAGQRAAEEANVFETQGHVR